MAEISDGNAPLDTPPDDPSDVWVFVVIGAVICLASVAAVIIVLKKKKK